MNPFEIGPSILEYSDFSEFADDEKFTEKDLIFTNEFIYDPAIKKLGLPCKTLFLEKYGTTEPTDIMIDQILFDLENEEFDRIIAVGGGSVMDIAKCIAVADKGKGIDHILENGTSLTKKHFLYAVATTCGTGSEITKLAALFRTKINSKMGFGCNAMYADRAVLISSMLNTLPYNVFATSSTDAMVHASEAFLSPNACSMSEMFSEQSLALILPSWKAFVEAGGGDEWKKYTAEFLRGSNYAGIAFGYAGTGAVHATSYPLGGIHHIPHGQSNQLMFADVMRKYKEKQPVGKINRFEEMIAPMLGCTPDTALENLYSLMSAVLPKSPLREHGVTEDELPKFASSVIREQQRLLRNNYTELTEEDILDIYRMAY